MLWLARRGQDISDTEPVEFDELVEAAWTIATDEANGTTLTITEFESDGENERRLKADDERLQQLLENLFRNAIDHAGEDVTVTIGRLPDGFYIEDDGSGIPEADRDAVFEAGYSTRANGTGFGLKIVKQIVDAHDWDIRVLEGSKGGARFEITGVDFVTG